MQQGIQADTTAIQGLAGGNIGQAISGAASPYLAEQIHKLTEGNPEAQAMAHAVVGAVTSYAAGNSALAGAAGAASGELMAQLVMNQLYPGKAVSELTETEKQTISALGTLAAGLAGGVTGDSAADAVAGAQAGKNSVENNALSVAQNKSRSQEMAQCQGTAACEKDVVDKYKKINAEQNESVVGCKGAQECIDKANEVGKIQADYANRTNELLEKARVDGSLSPEEQNELSILQVTTIQLEADRNAAIHNALMSGDSSEAKQLAINSLSQVAGTSAAGIAAGVGKAGAKGLKQDKVVQSFLVAG